MSKPVNSWDNASEVTKSSSVANEVTRIPLGTEVRQALLISSDDIRIDGRFFGKILTKGKVILGEKAIFKGDINCENADIYGSMEGNLVVGDVLSLMSTCSLNGSLSVVRLSVENGAKFDGTCQILSKDEYNKLATDFQNTINKECPPTSVDNDKKGNKVKVDFAVSDAGGKAI